MLFSMRDTSVGLEFDALPELLLKGLGDDDAQLLLASEIHAPMDPRIRDRIVAEARGNPLAVLEFSRSARLMDVAAGFVVPELPTTASRIEASFVQRMSVLPNDSQMLLTVASAEPLGDPMLFWQALQRLGIAREAVDPAAAAGLIEVGQRVRFPHPLARSAAYGAALPADRRRAHEALAKVTDPIRDPDRRAWHQAQTALGTDEGIAADLERSADRARAHGGVAAAAALTERAAELTPDAARRAARTLNAAQMARSAGALDSALRLLTIAEAGPLDAHERGSAKLQRAQIAFQMDRDDNAAGSLLEAATTLDGDRSRDAYLEAFAAAMYVGRSNPTRLRQVAAAARAAPRASQPPRPVDLLLDGLCAHVVLGREAAVPTLRRAVAAMSNDDDSPDDLRWLGLACTVAMLLRDDRAHASLADRQVRLARASGAVIALPLALNYRAGVHVFGGELTEAASLVGEAYAVEAATGTAKLIYADLMISAWRGDEQRVKELIRNSPDATARGEGRTKASIEFAIGVLSNGLGTYQAALDATKEAEKYDELGFDAFLPAELVEAASRLGRPELAALAIERLAQRARVYNTDWAVGMDLRSRALLSDGPETDDLYVQAIARLGLTRLSAYVARTQLVYGEWLRRKRRRTEAREQLREAYEKLSAMGLNAFARRAAGELQATGEHPRQRRVDLLDTLTIQELNILHQAASGATSKEIAARLFLSPRTIDAHLRNIFQKTGATSRRQLRELALSVSAMANPDRISCLNTAH
jgi:DNA-binding CsgD family transcriptional regulator